jgi:molybdopterin-guanine dinucleotide biosynthesis protein A
MVQAMSQKPLRILERDYSRLQLNTVFAVRRQNRIWWFQHVTENAGKIQSGQCEMSRTAAILAGGESRRLKDKALIPLAGKPMILHVIDKCKDIVDEILVIVNSKQQIDAISNITERTTHFRIVADTRENFVSPLLGARTAFVNSSSKVTLLLPCDSPLIKTSVLELLFSAIDDWEAVVPRYPAGHIEPLHASYKTDISRKVVEQALSSGERSMKDLIMKLRALYLSTDIIRRLDPELDSLTNINTIEELRKVEDKINREDS